jgi:hypothetical protein
VEPEIGNWNNGRRELRLHCTKAGVNTNVIVTHKIFPSVTKAIPVTCTANQNPRIIRFYELNNNLNPKPWDSLRLKWQLNDPEGQGLTCKIDLDGNNTWDHIQNGCIDGQDYAHVWNPNQTGARNIKLRVEDGYGGAAEAYLGFVVQSGNKAPVISSFTATPSNGTAPLTVTYAWSVSDPDNDATTCSLDVDGNGTFEYSYPCSSRSSQSHTFNSNGSFNSRFKVTDGRGGEVGATRAVTFEARTSPPTPPVTPTQPQPCSVFFLLAPDSAYSLGHLAFAITDSSEWFFGSIEGTIISNNFGYSGPRKFFEQEGRGGRVELFNFIRDSTMPSIRLIKNRLQQPFLRVAYIV